MTVSAFSASLSFLLAAATSSAVIVVVVVVAAAAGRSEAPERRLAWPAAVGFSARRTGLAAPPEEAPDQGLGTWSLSAPCTALMKVLLAHLKLISLSLYDSWWTLLVVVVVVVVGEPWPREESFLYCAGELVEGAVRLPESP